MPESPADPRAQRDQAIACETPADSGSARHPLTTEAQLRRSEARYRALFENIDAGFCICDVKFDEDGRAIDHRVLEANPAFERYTGLVDAIGRYATEVAPGIEQHWHDAYGQVVKTGRPVRFEGEAAPLGRRYDAHLIPVGEGQVAMLITDVTARRLAEDTLRKLNASLEAQVAERTSDRNALWQLSSDIMLRCTFEGVMTAVNPAWTDLLGWSEAELIGANLFDFIHPDDMAHTVQGARELSEGTRHARFDNRYRHRDGSYRWISWATRPADGLINAVGRDATAEREQAEALTKAEEALRQSQKMEAVGQLTGGLAHDFNNLLAGISGSLELTQTRIQQGRFTDVERYMAAALGASKRAAALTHRLLAFSRRQTLDPKPTDVNLLVFGMQEMVQRTVGPGIPVEVVGASGLWPVLVDPSQLENALLNLCINARDAMPDGGRITIETANKWLDKRALRGFNMPDGQYLSLCVTDTGTGMSSDVIARVFEPFFTTKPTGEGTGLGLSMIYGFAQQSGGQVRIHSEVGRGTTVCIYLPRYDGEVTNETQSAKLATLERSHQEKTVLVVDDEPTVRMLVTDILEDLGHTAIEASDSATGLKILQSNVRIDLLVTDVGLPGGMNGRQMADAGRVFRPDLKVLFITGYAESTVLDHGYLAQGMAVLTKPFPIETMAMRICSMIEAGQEAKQWPLG